jgi:hypothetical protein
VDTRHDERGGQGRAGILLRSVGLELSIPIFREEIAQYVHVYIGKYGVPSASRRWAFVIEQTLNKELDGVSVKG